MKSIDNLLESMKAVPETEEPNTKCQYYRGGGDNQKYCVATTQTTCEGCRFSDLTMKEKIDLAYNRLYDLQTLVSNHITELQELSEYSKKLIEVEESLFLRLKSRADKVDEQAEEAAKKLKEEFNLFLDIHKNETHQEVQND